MNGMPISIGKLSLYVAGAGIRPESTMPICLDLGTNTQKYLDDPLYLGARHKRVSDQVMTEFMDEFMREMSVHFPKLLVQFEVCHALRRYLGILWSKESFQDFTTDHAFAYLDRYRNKYPVFNDDIQGTGAVVLSGFINAAKLASEASGQPLTSHRILFFGAGSAGVGVAMQLMSFFTMQGLSKEEARDRIYFVDSQGLIYDSRGPMAEHKKCTCFGCFSLLTTGTKQIVSSDFSRHDYNGRPMKDLFDIISYVKPTALLGLSTMSGAFTPDVIQAMAALNARPIVFPLCELISTRASFLNLTLYLSEPVQTLRM